MPELRACLMCGKEFTPQNKRHQVCSRDCRRRHDNRVYRERHREECLKYSREWFQANKATVYAKRSAKRAKNKPPCVVCGRQIGWKRIKTCSDTCAMVYKKRYQKKYAAEIYARRKAKLLKEWQEGR